MELVPHVWGSLVQGSSREVSQWPLIFKELLFERVGKAWDLAPGRGPAMCEEGV